MSSPSYKKHVMSWIKKLQKFYKDRLFRLFREVCFKSALFHCESAQLMLIPWEC